MIRCWEREKTLESESEDEFYLQRRYQIRNMIKCRETAEVVDNIEKDELKDGHESVSQYQLTMQDVCEKKFSAEKQKVEPSGEEQLKDLSKEEQVTDLSEEEQLKALLEEEQEEEEEYQKSWKEIFLSKNVEMETLQCNVLLSLWLFTNLRMSSARRTRAIGLKNTDTTVKK